MTLRGKHPSDPEQALCDPTAGTPICPSKQVSDMIIKQLKKDGYLKNFHVDYGQCGAIFIINGEIKGLELFANPSLYQDYHEKIFRSYIMEAIVDYRPKYCSDNVYGFLREISHSEFRTSPSKGIGRHLQFANCYGYGAALFDGCSLVHLNYFNNCKSRTIRRKPGRRYGTFRDFVDDS